MRFTVNHVVIFYVALFFIFPALVSCHEHRFKKNTFTSSSEAEHFAEKLARILKPVDTTNGGSKLHTTSEYMRYVYQVSDYQSVWMINDKPGPAAQTFLQELQQVKWEGLNPEKYHFTALNKLNEAARASKNSTIDRLLMLDTMLTESYLAVSHDLLFGEVLPADADSTWHHKNDTLFTACKALLNNDEHYVSLNSYKSSLSTYALLRGEYRKYDSLAKDSAFKAALLQVQNPNGHLQDSATKGAISYIIHTEVPWAVIQHNDSISDDAQSIAWYQAYMGLKATGKLDSVTLSRMATKPEEILKILAANMERIRWMQKDFGDTYVLVNVPMMEFFLTTNNQLAMHMRTVVGKPIRQTPSLDADMANVVINPPWGVPPTILKKDVLPGITKSGGGYLARKGLKAYDHQGNRVSASAVTRANYKRYTFRQDPGDDNALGYVKFNLPNKWDIYLHDTPHRGDFVKNYRALSSGCIRLQQPQELALYILSQMEKKRYTQERLDSIIATHKTRWEVLKTKIPVHVVYLTNYEDTTGKHVRFVNDIYNRDGQLISLMK